MKKLLSVFVLLVVTLVTASANMVTFDMEDFSGSGTKTLTATKSGITLTIENANSTMTAGDSYFHFGSGAFTITASGDNVSFISICLLCNTGEDDIEENRYTAGPWQYTADSNGKINGNAAYNINVYYTQAGANKAPVVKGIPGESINEGGKFATIKLDDYVSDDHDAASQLTWAVSGNNKLKVTISADRVATIATPDQYWNGNEDITFTATDTQGASGSQTVSFNVESVNNAPVVAQFPDQTIDEGKLFAKIKLDDYVKDPDHRKDQLEWEVDIQPNGKDQADGDLNVEIDDNRVATIVIPNEDWYGSAKIKFTATDPEYASNSKTAIFTVKPINDAPVFPNGIPGQTIDEKKSFADITLTDYVTDVDDQISKIKWTVTDGKELKIDINKYGVASIKIPNEYWYGSETFLFTATDPAGASASTKVTFTVNSVNDAPVFTQDIPDQTIDEKEEFAVVELKKCISDPDHTFEQLKWTNTGTKDLKVVLNGTTATIRIPNKLWNGSETITFRATDPEGAYAESTATFTVNSVNDVPTFVKAIPNQTIDEGNQFSKIKLDEYVKDADHKNNELAWEAEVEHQGTMPAEGTIKVDIDDNRIANISIPNTKWNGSAKVKFTCTDPEGASIEQDVTLTVTSVNDLPEFTKDIPGQVVYQGAEFDVIALDEYITDADHDIATLSWTTEVTNTSGESISGISVEIGSDRKATINASSDYSGIANIKFIATDPENGSADKTAQFIVVKVEKIEDQTYTGEAIEPEVTIMAGTTKLTEGTDYECSYYGNTEVGQAEVTITLKGAYATKFVCNMYFAIVEATPTAIKKVEKKAEKTVKTVENGEIVIIRGGEKFNLRGAKIK